MESSQSHWSHTNVFTNNFEQISQLVLVILLLTLKKENIYWVVSSLFFLLLLELATCGMWFAICIYLLFKGDGYYKTSNQEVVSYILWKAVAFLFLWEVVFVWIPEAATWGALKEKMLLEISQNSQRNTHVRVSFLIKLQLQLY